MSGLSSEWVIPRLHLPTEAADFYLLEYMAGARNYKPAKAPYRKKIKFLADAFARYFPYAIYTELEILGDQRYGRKPLKCRPGTVARKLYTAARKGKLKEVWYNRLSNKRTRKPTLRAASALFHKEDWLEGFGGRAWGQIVDVLLAYHEKKLKPKLFVDRMWSIEHNGGTALNKSSNFSGCYQTHYVLDAQADCDLYELCVAASAEVKHLFAKFNKKAKVL